MSAGFGASGSGGQGFAIRLEADGDTKLGNSDGDLHQVTGTLQLNDNVFFLANGRVGLGDSAPGFKLTVGGSMEVGEYIYHRGDTNTFIRFQTDSVNLQAGGADFITLTEATQDEVVINESSADIDFRVESNNATNMLHVDGASNRIGIGTGSPQHTVDIQERSGVEAVLRIMGDSDVGIRLAADSDNSGENDNPYIDFYQDGQNSNSRNNRLASLAMEGDAAATFTGSLANAVFIDAFCPGAINSNLRTIQFANDSSNNGHAARITIEGTNGNVGIHTNAPPFPLTVQGTTSVTGTLMVTNPADTSDFYTFPSGDGAANSVLTATGANALQFTSPDLLITQVMVVAVTEENTNIQTGTSQVTVRAPFAAMITAVRGSLSTASSSGAVEFDINIGGGSIFSTRPTIDANEKTTTTAATAAVFANNPTPMSDDAEITFDIDSAGTGARGLKVAIYYVRSS